MSGSQSRVDRRRRGASLEEALLEAAWLELKQGGYDALRMETIAMRAKTSKAVLYRRWSTRAELVLAALRRHAGTDTVQVDTGTLRGDVMAILKWLSDRYGEFPDVVRGLMVELPEADGDVTHTSRTSIDAALKRATMRGEIADQTISDPIVCLPLDLARYEMFVTQRPLEIARIVEIVDLLFLPLLPRTHGHTNNAPSTGS